MFYHILSTFFNPTADSNEDTDEHHAARVQVFYWHEPRLDAGVAAIAPCLKQWSKWLVTSHDIQKHQQKFTKHPQKLTKHPHVSCLGNLAT